jgi:hypothetical protein
VKGAGSRRQADRGEISRAWSMGQKSRCWFDFKDSGESCCRKWTWGGGADRSNLVVAGTWWLLQPPKPSGPSPVSDSNCLLTDGSWCRAEVGSFERSPWAELK